jgi:uncharacterized membrane protein YbhN (UPF0104 family)
VSVLVRVSAVGTRLLDRQPWARRCWRAVEAHARLAVLIGIGILAAAAATAATVADHDAGQDFGAAAVSVLRAMAHLRWQYGAVVIALAALHYFASALAARAAAGSSLPYGETFLVALSAAAANRITPAGIGGSALTGRYFVRRGGLSAVGAAGSVVAMTVLGAVADFATLLVIVLVGGWVGLAGGASEIGVIVSGVRSALGPARSPWLWLVVAIVGAGLTGSLLSRHRVRLRRWIASFVAPVRVLVRTPSALATLLLASASTTLILSVAFVATTAMVPGPQPATTAGALIVAFMLGSAAGNLVPVPAGLGATEAALVAVLVAARVPVANALEDVLIFRLITFWLPAAAGVPVAALLRRRGAF